MSFRKCVVAFACVISLIGAASAQVNPFTKNTAGLSRTDINLLEAAAAKLYKSSNPKVGASRTWANAKSGHSGVVRIIGVKKPCVRLRHTIKQKGVTDAGVFAVSRCNVNGTWQRKF
ncbi:MAG: hypothetical protein ACR2PM_20450 [Hyphomicrobiales bacterium]